MIQSLFTASFIRFAMVGSLGFIIDLSCMVLLSFWLPVPLARGLAFWIAASSNWFWNRCITFKTAPLSTKQATLQWAHFLICSCIAFIPNCGSYYLLLQIPLGEDTPDIICRLWPYLAMVPGVLLGLLFNYFFARLWVFSNPPSLKQ